MPIKKIPINLRLWVIRGFKASDTAYAAAAQYGYIIPSGIGTSCAIGCGLKTVSRAFIS